MATKRTRDYDPKVVNPPTEDEAPQAVTTQNVSDGQNGSDGNDYTITPSQLGAPVQQSYNDDDIQAGTSSTTIDVPRTQTTTTKTPSAYDELDNIYSDRFGLTKQEQKRRRRDEMISSIGDAVTALGSMYFAKKDGVPVYDPAKSMTEATLKRYDRLLKERNQTYKDYLQHQRLSDLAAWRKQQGANKEREIDIKMKDLERKNQIADAQAKRYLALQDKDSAQAAYYEKLIEGLEAKLPLEQAKLRAQEARERAAANASNASANLSNARAANVGAEENTEYVMDDLGNKVGQRKTYTPRGSGQNGNTGGGKTPLPKAEPAQTQQTTPNKKRSLPRNK